MPKSGIALSPHMVALVTAALISLCGPSPVYAQAAAVEGASPARVFVLKASTGINGFDWLATPRANQPVRYVPGRRHIVRQLGSGSYICSPAGSGQKSRCSAN